MITAATPSLLTKREAARALGVSERTIDRLRADGTLRSYRIRGSIRIDPADLRAVMARDTFPSTPTQE